MNTATKVPGQATKKDAQRVYIGAVFQGIERFIISKSSVKVSNKHFVTLNFLHDEQLSTIIQFNSSSDKIIEIPRSQNIIGLLEMKLYEMYDSGPKYTDRFIMCGIAVNNSWSDRWRVKTEDAMNLAESYIKAVGANKPCQAMFGDAHSLIIQQINFVKPYLRYFMFTGHEKDRRVTYDINKKYNNYIYAFCGLGDIKTLNDITHKIAHDLFEKYQTEDILPF